MNRREFLSAAAAAGVAVAGASTAFSAARRQSLPARRFSLYYAPHFGMFRHRGGGELLDQVHFMADEGFTALEDNGLLTKPVEFQRQLGRELVRRQMQMGVFVATADYGRPTFASQSDDDRKRVLTEMQRAVDAARRVNCHWCSVVPGKLDSQVPLRQQMLFAIETLKHCVDVCEPAGLVMLIEPLHHGGPSSRLFLHSMAQAFQLCRAVDSPHCKILFDVYQQHALGENVVGQLERFWPHVGYVQVGDSPGRKEPGTGDIDFAAIFKLLRDKNYNGIVGMEHGNSLPGATGERAVIDAYLSYEAGSRVYG